MCVGFIGLDVASPLTGKDTICAEVDEASGPGGAELGKTMWQERVNSDAGDGRFRFNTLLNDSYTVDDHARTMLSKKLNERIPTIRINVRNHLGGIEQGGSERLCFGSAVAD